MKNNQQINRLMVSDLTVWEELDEEQQAQIKGGFNLNVGVDGIFGVSVGVDDNGVNVGVNVGSQDN